ncbi:biopolymer transporter ExbD [Pseudotenacibaculum sp. MALMAid0570]|uniref:ExbD/TolR family protein n=1 Tax=Pseudotenacibaculum sp. MALMAid0570 TaxID=3143938 RepID=UPI0032DE86CB
MRRELPPINAGSMADIAFLLLIFFLVTTTMDVDQGIFTKLPRKTTDPVIDIKEKNLLAVTINGNNELFVEDKTIDISQLTQIAVNFIDNGGGTDKDGNPCSWCQGAKDPASSDHPSKALIAIEANRAANYETYITVLDHLHRAYSKLRDRYALQTYQMSYKDMVKEEKKKLANNALLRERIKKVQEKYPLLISDSQIQN